MQRKSNPILGDGKAHQQRGIKTFTNQIKPETLPRTPNRHQIPDHTVDYFYKMDDTQERKPLRKSVETFKPSFKQDDPLNKKLSQIYSQKIKISRTSSRSKTEMGEVSPSKRRQLDNKSQLFELTDYDNMPRPQTDIKVKDIIKNIPHFKACGHNIPTLTQCFDIDTIKHRRDYNIQQENTKPKSKEKHIQPQQTYLRSVKKSNLLDQYKKK
ncbi:hypothetical protein pb186bvf_005972 [Paramecium bursaria]